MTVSAIKFDHPYAPKHDLEHELRLPDLDTFEFGPLPELDSLDESTTSEATPLFEPEEDLWQEAFELGPAKKDVLFHTWEGFENPQHVETQTAYLTERGAGTFDAALQADSSSSKIGAGKVIKSSILLQSLWNLGLGRASILFKFNTKLKSFEPTLSEGRASGVSLRAAQSLVSHFIYTGNTFLYLRSFAERTFASTNAISARVALATTVASVLYSLEVQLGRQQGCIRSLIQLQRSFSKPKEILAHMARMVEETKHAKTNEQLASILHHRLLELEGGDEDIRQLSSRIVCEVAKPSLELMAEWMGTLKEQETIPIASRNSFVAVEPGTSDDDQPDYTYRSEMMPRFISPEDGNTIFETGLSLRFLKNQHADHPLVRLHDIQVTPPAFEWAFGWQDIEAIAAKAKLYEDRLRQSLLAYSKGSGSEVLRSGPIDTPLVEERQTSNLEAYFENSIRQLDESPKQLLNALPDEVLLVMQDMLDLNMQAQQSSNFAPPLSLTSSLSFRPLILAQAKLVNAATLRLFFRSHKLRHHLTLQRQYHLLGDGVFSSLLSTALFDPERESAERHKGQMRSGVHMGLQLGSRTSWPPASSELRLALRGVLSESYYSSALYQSFLSAGEQSQSKTTVTGRDNDELPGQLNFAIRNLSEAEQEKVMDPDALPALDFLRLQYVPPLPLNLVITSASLDKYDLVFKFLLRLLRMLFVIAHLPQNFNDIESRLFKLEAHHFVTMFSSYVFQSGIAGHWQDFDNFVGTLEMRINEEDAAGEYGSRVTEGIASLRDAHDKCLDGIMFSLFLRNRQRKILALVDDIFDHILLFAKMQHAHAKVDENVKQLYDKLRGKIRVFLSVCRSLTGKKGYGSGKGTAEENLMERLVLGFQMNGYFGGA